MTDRDRLIELLDECIEAEFPWDHNGCIADYLLANGVIVPPCKVGDTVYRIYTRSWVGEDKVSYFAVDGRGLHYVDDKGRETSCDKFGKTVFLTREEAERELEKRGEQNACND